MKFLCILFLLFVTNHCESYKILAVFPHDGRSHHIFFSSLVEELAKKGHEVTAINYHPMKKIPKLRQIVLQDIEENDSHNVDMQGQLRLMSSDVLLAYDAAKAFKGIANANCKMLMTNPQIQELMTGTESFDVVIVEQFVTDCGLAVAYKIGAPTVGMTTHILMPWTYERLGASNNPAYVPNRRTTSGTRPNFFNRIKSAIINFGLNMYFTHVIQKTDQEIVNKVYPEIPSLEDLGRNMTMIMLNQYFPLTGPRIYGPNVVEIGGMHVNKYEQVVDKSLEKFLNSSENGVIYISFGTVAANFPRKIIDEIINLIESSDMTFVWKTDVTDWTPPSNAFVGKWLPQAAVLCHPNVVAFVTHSGMLSTSEAIHCGVPIVGVPLIGDQFANAASAVESGLGVIVDIATLDEQALDNALNTVLQKKYQERAKTLSRIWRDRPLPPMDTAIYWIEYVARNKGDVNLKPPTVDLPLYKYYMLDLLFVFGLVAIVLLCGVLQVTSCLLNLLGRISFISDEKKKS